MLRTPALSACVHEVCKADGQLRDSHAVTTEQSRRGNDDGAMATD